MTHITIQYTDNLCSFVEVKGHANYADKGHDIVCSGITTALFTSFNIIERLEKDCFYLDVKDDGGYLLYKLDYSKIKKENIQFISLVMNNLIDILKQLQEDYPKNLKINFN